MPIRKRQRVALIIETSSNYGRGLLSGVVRFMRTHDAWSVFVEQRDLTAKPPEWLDKWHGHGIISRSTNRHLADAVVAAQTPLVELTDRREDFGFPHIWSDDDAIARSAALHLIERGFRSFAYCGFLSEAWSTRRQESFVKHVSQACAVYNSRWLSRSARPWEDEQQKLIEWLRPLPKPLGIMACNDVRAQQLLDACSQARISVPEEVAVIGVDNDELLCELCEPSLSSVVPNAELIGYLAAETLAQLMAGGAAEQQERLIDPVGIAARQSTDVVAIDDTHVASALSFIREHASQGITVDDVLERVPLTRSSLERRFRKLLKRSPQQEIRNVQIKRAKQLLAETDLPIDHIAHLCGFKHAEYMHVVFKREMDMTPGQFRKTTQP